jgi:hypothetical protein
MDVVDDPLVVYQTNPAIFDLHRVLATVTNLVTVDSFSHDIPATLDLIKNRFQAYTTNPTMAAILTHGHSWLLPAIILSAYLSQRTTAEQTRLSKEYNELLTTLETMESEYRRMAEGKPNPNVAAQKRHIREVVHEPDPAYLMLPMFTGKKEIKPQLVQAVAKTMQQVKQFCVPLRSMTLNELAHYPPESYLVTCFAEFLAANYALKRLLWPDRYKKDKEYAINPITRKNAMQAMQRYRLDQDGTLWHVDIPGRWPRPRDPTEPRQAVKRVAFDI